MSAQFRNLKAIEGVKSLEVPLTGQVVAPGTLAAEWKTPETTEARASESVGLDEIFARLWRRKLVLLSLALVGVGMAAAITFTRVPVYRARTAIRLEEPDDYRNLSGVLPLAANSPTVPNEAWLQNELKVLESETLAKRVAIRLGIDPSQKSEDRLSRLLPPSLLARLHPGRRSPSPDELRIKAVQKALTVRSSLKSQVVEIFFDSTNPTLAARGANTVVEEYIAITREARLQSAQDTTEWLAGQISEMKAKLDQGNEQLQSFARSAGLLYTSDQNSLLTEQSVREVEEQLSKARADRADKQSRYETAVSGSPQALPNGADSGLLREYEGTLAGLRRERTQLLSMYTPSHYKVVDVEARIAQLEQAIRDERQHMIDRMHSEYESADRLELALSHSYADQTRRLEAQTADAFRYNVLKRELDNTQQLYNSLLQKSKEAGVASALRATSVRVIDGAAPPAAPYSPNLPLNCALGLSGGLFLAVACVLIVDRNAARQPRPGESGMYKIRELGVIPAAKHDPALQSGRRGLLTRNRPDVATELVTRKEQPSLLTESFRAALASIRFSPGLERKRGVFSVTSVQPLEGKTTTVSNLGVALAETGARVLLVDADLRRPRLHKVFEKFNETGLMSILTADEAVSEMDLDSLVRPTGVPGLFMLPSGPGSANVTPLLYSERMAQFIHRARAEFDFVLIDTPPAGMFSDARVLGRLSDSVIFVIHAEKTSHQELDAIYLQFMEDGTRVLGTILNHWDVKRRSGYYSNYSYGGGAA